jgi:hypothetical protein
MVAEQMIERGAAVREVARQLGLTEGALRSLPPGTIKKRPVKRR